MRNFAGGRLITRALMKYFAARELLREGKRENALRALQKILQIVEVATAPKINGYVLHKAQLLVLLRQGLQLLCALPHD